ncbi:MAG TPA: hypothetical protein VF995_10850 [Actinomycetota bacterium]
MTAETGAASSRTATPGDPFTVLFVCTGNICRSAMAEVFARRELASHPGLEVPLRFSSAGSYAMEGNRAVEASAVAAEARGASLERHRARQLTRRRVAAADLILCMEAEHRSPVLALDRAAGKRTFLLGTFARAIAELEREPPGTAPPASPAELAALAAERLREQPGDGVDDPYGCPAAAHAACARRLDDLVSTVAASLLKTVRAPA